MNGADEETSAVKDTDGNRKVLAIAVVKMRLQTMRGRQKNVR